jgi:hypothetical protein
MCEQYNNLGMEFDFFHQSMRGFKQSLYMEINADNY